MAWVEIMPKFESLFRQQGWDCAAPFLAWSGVLVNRHRYRRVEQVRLPTSSFGDGNGDSFYLKKQDRVTWRERFRNAWHGFGWCATAVREAAILQAARSAGVGCPEVAAFGEGDSGAFVLVRDEADRIELRTLLASIHSDEERGTLAAALGAELARLHDAGFDHPDLFTKHILVSRHGKSIGFCILDWARSRRQGAVSWALRCRDLAALDATLHPALAGDRLRLRCLRAYVKATKDVKQVPLRSLVGSIRGRSERLQQRRNIREIRQAPTPACDQQFVPVCDGQLLVVRSYFEQQKGCLPDWLLALPKSNVPVEDFSLTVTNTLGSQKLCLQTRPRPTATWDIPPLAHTLFRLQRFGVTGPRLLAVGASSARVFHLLETPVSATFGEAIAKTSMAQRGSLLEQAGRLVRRIHEAGYALPMGDSWARRLGVVRETGEVVLAIVEPFTRSNGTWQELAPVELNRQQIRLSRPEQLRFLAGYLGSRRERSVNTKRPMKRERQQSA